MPPKIKILCVGKTSESFIREGVKLYEQRIIHFASLQIVEIQDVKINAAHNKLYLKEKETLAVLKQLTPHDIVILLDEKGFELNSLDFAAFIEKNIILARPLVFIIGGAYGFSDLLYQRANHKISLSALTFTHQLVRLVFMEQLYRAFTIIKNIPYHNQ